MLALAALFACTLKTDPDQAVAIEVILPDSGRVEVTDTFRPIARALNEVGDSVVAQVYWSSFDPDTIEVLDSTTGVSLAKIVGSGQLQARVGALRSNPQNVAVLAKLDSLRAAGDTRDTVLLPDSLSDSLRVQAFATGGAAVSRRVVYTATIYPASGPVITLLPNDSVLTNSAGIGFVQVRMLIGSIPDSVVVTASIKRFDGSVVPDSVTFVVEFRP